MTRVIQVNAIFQVTQIIHVKAYIRILSKVDFHNTLTKKYFRHAFYKENKAVTSLDFGRRGQIDYIGYIDI